MKKLLAIAITAALILTGCASEPELGEVSSVIQDSQEMQAEESQSPEPEPLPTYELSTLSVDPNLCKFEDKTFDVAEREPWNLFSYFPNRQIDPYFLSSVGELEVALVFIDWADKKGTQADTNYYLEQTERMSSWFDRVSQGKLQISWSVSDEWGELSGSWKDYRREDNDNFSDEERAPWEQWFLDEVVAATDKSFDYSGIDYVVIAMPLSGALFQTASGPLFDVNTVMTSGTQGMAFDLHEGSLRGTALKSSENKIGNWVISGTSFQDLENRSPAWVHWAHELGHMFGFVSHSSVPNPPNSDTIYQNTLYGVGLFADQWLVTRVVATWTAWVAGWLDDDQIQCVDADDITDDVFAIQSFRSKSKGAKALIIRTSETTGLVIESRDWNPDYDFSTPLSEGGFYNAVVMYSIDSRRRIGDESLVALTPGSTREMWDEGKWPAVAHVYTDIYFHEGQSAEFEGLKIEPVSLQDGVDFVRVSRAEG